MPVGSRYELVGSGYGFSADRYDAGHELVIDPGLDYSTFLGGTSHDFGTGIVVDAAGNAYVVGVTQSPNFPTTSGAFDRTGAAGNNLDVFVTKINSTGTALVYSTFVGGTNFDWGRGIAIDAATTCTLQGRQNPRISRPRAEPSTGHSLRNSIWPQQLFFIRRSWEETITRAPPTSPSTPLAAFT